MPLTLPSFCERRTVTQALTFVCGLSCAVYNGMEKMKWRKSKTEKKNLRFQKYPAALCGILEAYWLIEVLMVLTLDFYE